MGLTMQSTGTAALDAGLHIDRTDPAMRVIAVGGNPNVGKSTVVNALTGLRQHTGNWPGKTVSTAQGSCCFEGKPYTLVDIPGTYSLFANSAEEEAARDFLCFGGADAAIIVCDATCLERNLNLVLQAIEILPRTAVCVNLMDEAERKGIRVDLHRLQEALGVPVTAASARTRRGLKSLMRAVSRVSREEAPTPPTVTYSPSIERAASRLLPLLCDLPSPGPSARWLSLRLLEPEESWNTAFYNYCAALPQWETIRAVAAECRDQLTSEGVSPSLLQDLIASRLIARAEQIAQSAVTAPPGGGFARDRKLDRLFTSRWTGIPVMLLLLALIFWITITGANVPSELLSSLGTAAEDGLARLFETCGAPDWLTGAVVHGMFRVLCWVVSVMLPPMAIFFPLFTILEDFGYLPRVAFNLDHAFQKAHACGKQALTMCMGFGCNAAGVVGCRIIDSPRERLIATVTNSFVPCNGKFPTLITILTIFFAAGSAGGLVPALLLTGIILLGILMTFLVSRLLSATILRGVPSSFTLELPPYRRPQIGQILVRSVLDRTLFVLARAAAVAAPAGLLLWILANVDAGGMSLLAHCAQALDPIGRVLGLDGAILLAFLLGIPANEIVVPILIMTYMAGGSLTELSLPQLQTLLLANGWTWRTAVCMVVFSLLHWPCATTLATIYRETKSLKWTAASFLVPTLCGAALCALIALIPV
ncbi:ferrous iron transport protein B [Anaeromassilibacillus sp. An200]|uniref:Ferrous iron transport protein B n=1 Tax=Candidatus Caccousia stercoris TaxID=2840723 RepID=A0A9D1K179_9FIRM|nr:ferrous iron transport protein B [Anaeromassilibacillus sp. An200]OUP13323.1 ferrous iron transport protein B [Anaeromassilibacillus sp. An200]HIS78080.1 ferrous iron transport protein B [Candidatus Caccousia stercoris]